MPGIEVEIEIFCGTCGKGLCGKTVAGKTTRRGVPCFNVEACQKCVDAAQAKGYDEGYDNGYVDGAKEGEATR